jgi:hypothetical protein
VECREEKKWADPEKKVRVYILNDKTHELVIRASAKPLSHEMTTMILKRAHKVDDSERANLRDHAAYFRLDFISGPGRDMDSARFVAIGLQALMEDDRALGIANYSAEMYTPAKNLEYVLNSSHLDASLLFHLLVNPHNVHDEGRYWMHTHGMDQFGLPDIQLFFGDLENAARYDELRRSVAVYMIENGPILMVGDTFDMDGNGSIYEITRAEEERAHAFGDFGVLELARLLANEVKPG